MMIAAYHQYLTKEVDNVNSYSTKTDYKEKALRFYHDQSDEKPPYLEEAEKLIGFTD